MTNMLIDIETTKGGYEEGEILVYDEKKGHWVSMNIDPKKELRKQREKKLKRILNEK
jgi:hypothetical protein